MFNRLFLLIFIVSCNSFADVINNTPTSSSSSENTITVGITKAPLPPYWTGSLLLPKGLVHDIAVLMESRLGVDVEYVAYETISDIQDAIIAGELDLGIGYIKSAEREDSFLFSNPIYEEALAGWISDEKSEVLDVATLRWACLKGNAQCALLRNLHFDNVIEVDNYRVFYEMLRSNDVDALIGLYVSFLHHFKNNNINEGKIFFDKRFGVVQSRFMLNVNNHSLVNKLNDFILDVKKDHNTDIFKDIYSTYNPQQLTYNSWYKSDGDQLIIRYTAPANTFPYSYIDEETGQYVGYMHDLFERLSSITPIEFEYVPPGVTDVSDMLLGDFADVVPMVNSNIYSEHLFATTKETIDVKFTHIETLNKHQHNVYGILDRYGLLRHDSRINDFVHYTSLENIMSDLNSGKITDAYINRHIVDNIIDNSDDIFFRVLPKDEYLDIDTKFPMLVRKQDIETSELLEEALNLVSQTELDALWKKYEQVEYQIGYNERDIRSVVYITLAFIASILLIFFYITLQMRRKIDGANKKRALSEGQRKFLFDIINNIPSYVCIRDDSGQILLSNRTFKNFATSNHFKDESSALNELLENGKLELQDDLSEDSATETQTHTLAGRHFHIVNQSIFDYVENAILYMTVLTDITEIKEREAQLELVVQQKRNFLAIVSHELRTPISGIVGLMEMLEDRIDDQLSLDILNNAAASTSKLKLLVDDILDLSKLEAEQLRVNIERFNLALELCPLFRSFESAATRKGLSFQFHWVPSRYLECDIDLLRVSQILNNILSNAVKFTESGSVICRVELSSDTLSFLVKDMGIGMDNEELARVFDPFVQAQDNTARRYGGTGLGMSIVRSLLDLMGGDIEINSAKGLGTSVKVSIPVNTHLYKDYDQEKVYLINNRALTAWFDLISVNYQIQQPESAIVETNFYPDLVIKTLSETTTLNSVIETHSIDISTLVGHTLVVDDDPINRFLFKMQLDKLGVNSHLVADGNTAYDALLSEDNYFDVLITDFHMPGMNGLELATKVRTMNGRYASLPIIACTADNSNTVALNAEKAGINKVLYKPYELANLYDVLSCYLTTGTEIQSVVEPEHSSRQTERTNWFTRWDQSDRAAVAKAVIESLDYCLTELINYPENTKQIVHRLKGAAGALSLTKIVNLCLEVDLVPNNVIAKQHLINEVAKLLAEAKDYVNQQSNNTENNANTENNGNSDNSGTEQNENTDN